MKKMFKLLALGLGITLLAGCNKSKDEPAKEATTEEIVMADEIELDAAQYIELGQYKGLTVNKEEAAEVTDAAVEEQLKMYNDDIVEYEPIKDQKEVRDKDIVKLDIKCFIDGKEDETYGAENIDFIIGDEDNAWIQDVDLDYDGALIGKKVGDTAVINFKFADDYEYDNYAGLDAELRMKIKAVEKEKKLEINDAWAKEYMGADSLDALKKEIKEQLKEEAEMNASFDNETELWNQIVAGCKQLKEFPEEKVTQEIEAQQFMIEDYKQFENISEEEYCKEYLGGLSVEEYVQKKLIQQCAQQLIAEKEGITVTHADVTDELQQYVDGDDYATLEDVIDAMGGEETVKQDILANRVSEFLLQANNIQ